MNGTVLRSINNIYSVRTADGSVWRCRIKGKQLAQARGEYNPVVAGDTVEFTPCGTLEGLVTGRQERRSSFSRWNPKAQNNQTVCANMDIVVCVCSAQSPPFRPRFIDRVIACCMNVPVLVCMNKSDILLTEDEFSRFSLYGRLGFDIISVSALTGGNINMLKEKLSGKTAAFVGQSGVGKSSLINSLMNSLVNKSGGFEAQRVGDISRKYNRGRHTTTCASVLEAEDFTLIDTPGFREISVPHNNPKLLERAFPEFRDCKCAFDSCLHVNEPGCGVIKKAETGKIDPDRYESYLRMLESLEDRQPVWSINDRKSRI